MPRVEKVKINVKERLEDNTLDLSMSNLTEVPIKDIIPLKRATIIDLSSNNLQYLGKTFTTLTQLTRLDLSKNNLTILPDDFGKLKNLRHLDLYNNKLEHVPISFGNLKSLKYLDLKGNPLTPALAKIIGPCLTTKDCTDAAKNTVKIMTDMQRQVSVERDRLKQEAIEQEAISKAELEEIEKPKRKSKKERKLEQQLKEDEIKNVSASLEYDLSGSSNQSNKETKKSSSFFTKVFFTFLLILLSLAIFSYVTIAYPNEVYGLLNKIHPKLEKWVEVKMGEVNEFTFTAFDSFMTTYLA